jgi:hypothetical protein
MKGMYLNTNFYRKAKLWFDSYNSFLVAFYSVKGKYANSVYWDRLSTSIFLNEDSLYPYIQLIDGNGNKLEPAYGDWLKDQSNAKTSGKRPNDNFFQALDGDTSSASDCLQR